MILIVSIVLFAIVISQAQSSPLLRTAQHISCEDVSDEEISDCTDQWLDYYLSTRLDWSLCLGMDSFNTNLWVTIGVDQDGVVSKVKVNPQSKSTDRQACAEHIEALLSPIVDDQIFVPASNAQGFVKSSKSLKFVIPPIVSGVATGGVERMARFNGCEELVGSESEKSKCAETALFTYVYKNLKYPAEARSARITGIAVIQYTIEEDGMVTNAEILREIGGGCGDAALDVVESMNELDPPFVPGMQDGKPVSIRYALPVRFHLP